MMSDSDETMSSGSDSDYSDLDCEYDLCCRRSGSHKLQFDPTAIEDIILTISDKFNFSVLMKDCQVRKGILMTTGLALAGTLIGRHYGGRLGAAVGGAVGGACGVGVVAISMREAWKDIKGKLWVLFEVVYDYLSGLGLDDYTTAAKFIMQHSSSSTELAKLILNITSDVLGKKVLSSLSVS